MLIYHCNDSFFPKIFFSLLLVRFSERFDDDDAKGSPIIELISADMLHSVLLFSGVHVDYTD